MRKERRFLSALAAVPRFVFLMVACVMVAALASKVAAQYNFNVNEGWNAYWARAAWSGADLYPPIGSFTLNNYPPLWFYLTGALGHLAGDHVRAGRAIAAAALLLDAVVISLIAREIAGRHTGWWLAGTAFVALFGIYHQGYAGANDPQVAASLLMLVAVWLVVRNIDGPQTVRLQAIVVVLMIGAGLIKHSIVAAPLSVALFYLLSRRLKALATFVALSVAGVAIACAGLYLAYVTNVFSSLLLPKPYVVEVAYETTRDQLRDYGLLLAVIPFLAFRSNAKARLVLIYALVAMLQGTIQSGADGVDVNVFFDLLFCIAIGVGVMGAAVTSYVRQPETPARWARASVGWIAVALISPLLAAPAARDPIADAFGAVTDASFAADLQYIRSMPPGQIVCRDPTVCYWAGQPFNIDLNNIRSIAFVAPKLEDEFVARIERCAFTLIELTDDWTDRVNGPLTDRIREAITSHYEGVRKTKHGLYWRPRCG